MGIIILLLECSKIFTSWEQIPNKAGAGGTHSLSFCQQHQEHTQDQADHPQSAAAQI